MRIPVFKKVVVFLLLSLVISGDYIFAQNFDSLRNDILLAGQNDSLKAERYITLGYEYYYHALDSLILVKSLADTAFNVAKKANQPLTMSSALNLKAKASGDLGYYEEAIEISDQAIKILRSNNENFEATKLEDNKANYLLENGEYDKALELKIASTKIFKQSKDTLAYCIGLGGVGIIYLDRAEYKEASKYLAKAFLVSQQINNQPVSAYTSSNLAIAYHGLGLLDSAQYYYEFTRKNGTEFKDLHSLSEAYRGILLMDQGKYKEATEIYQKLISFYSSESQDLSLLFYKSLIAQSFAYRNQHDSAVVYLDQVDANIYRDRTFRQLEHLYLGYESYLQLENYEKAITYFKLHRELSDSLKNIEANTRFKEIEVKYETEKKEAQLKAQEIALLNANQQRNNLLTILGILFFFTIGAILFHRYRLKASKQIAELNLKMQHEAIKKLEQEKQLIGTKSLLKGQIAERKRIAQDLHDSLGGYWTSIKVHYRSLADLDNFPKTHKLHNKTEKMIADSYEELRRISHDMMPPGFAIGGIKGALEHLAHQYTEQIDLVLNFSGAVEEIDEVIGLTLYRIIQEALQNVIKHANATEAFVQLHKSDHSLSITIEDDGKGFDTTVIPTHKSGLGLHSIQERIKSLNGQMNIDSNPGNGTLLSFELPLLETIAN